MWNRNWCNGPRCGRGGVVLDAGKAQANLTVRAGSYLSAGYLAVIAQGLPRVVACHSDAGSQGALEITSIL